jgi:hypothetical protein
MRGSQRRSCLSWKNNSRKPRDLDKNRPGDRLKKGQLNLYEGKIKMGLHLMTKMMPWESVCYKTEWQCRCVLREYSSAPCMYSSPRISDGQTCGGRGIWTVNTIHLAGPAWSNTASWTSPRVTEFLRRAIYQIFWHKSQIKERPIKIEKNVFCRYS